MDTLMTMTMFSVLAVALIGGIVGGAVGCLMTMWMFDL